MSINSTIKGNYVDLLKLKADKIYQNDNFKLILSDDIWGKGTLLLKSGRHLSEELINKLINFGIKNISVDFVKKSETEKESLLKEFIKSQNALIVEKNILNSAWVVRNLVDIGFNEKNILVTGEPNLINHFLKLKKVNFIFVGFSLYEKCEKCVNKYSLLRDKHVYVIMESKDNLKKLEKNYSTNVKFLKKPLSAKEFNSLIIKALSANLLDFYTEEASVS